MSCDVTYEELAALTAGDLDTDRARVVREHLGDCDRCRRRLAALDRADEVLGSLRPAGPAPSAILAARRAIAEELRPAADQILTLAEAAAFLRIDEEDLGEILDELPAFELAGRVRIRRSRLIEWIAQRERDFARRRAASWAARAGGRELEKGAV
ncbi:MAG: zf-HC2 domain-containing protein [Planctomycetota bacterium]|jgi:anti-sigma factor RsiW